MRARVLFLLVLIAASGCTTPAHSWRTLHGERPIIIAHRGDSGNYPEHTDAAYRSAMALGADFIEADIVMTKDGVAICRHDLYLSKTTDIAAHREYASRKRTLNGRSDWFAFDFTHKEIESLRAVQPFAGRDQSYNGQFGIPTLRGLYTGYEAWRKELGLPHNACGLYIEIKKPMAHLRIDPQLDLWRSLSIADGSYRMSGKVPPGVYFQCFDRGLIEEMANTGRLPLPTIWLSSDPIDFDDLPKGIAGLGLSKQLIDIKDGRSRLVDEAHQRGLLVHVWTFRDDQLDGTGYDNGQAEIEAYLRAGVDGVFTDFPATGLAARRAIAEALGAEQHDREPLSVRIHKNSPRRFLRRRPRR